MTDPDAYAELSLLRAAAEDFYGLWELPAVLAERYKQHARTVAERAVRSLARKGHIVFVWGDPQPAETARLSAEEIEQVLSDGTFWDGNRPYSGKQVWICTTDEGETRLRSDDADVINRRTPPHRHAGPIGIVFGAAAAAQLILGAHRATLLHTTPLPAIVSALAIALVPVLCWIARYRKAGHIFVRPIALVLTLLGILAAIAALSAPFLGLIPRAAFPLVIFGVAATLATAAGNRRAVHIALLTFALGFVGVQVALTHDALWQAENTKRGINVIWR